MSLIERLDEGIRYKTGILAGGPWNAKGKHDLLLLQDCKAEIEQLRKERAEVERLLNVLLAGIKGSKK